MLLLTAIACLILPASLQDTGEVPQEFSLISSPGTAVIKHITKDVTLFCKNQHSGQSRFGEIFTIRIEKQTKAGGPWEHIADISEHSQSPTIEDPNVSAQGEITQEIVGSYIEVSWGVASDDTIGTYRCDIAGVDKDLDILSERTPSVEIKEKDLSTSEVFDILVNRLQQVENELQHVEKEFNTKWPRGRYVLLQPNTGCPNDPAFVEGETGMWKIHTESSNVTSSQTTMSEDIHLSTPIVEREGTANFVNLRFCAASVAASSVHWPAGSYCINRYLYDCPLGFLNGTSRAHLDEENTNYMGTWMGSFFPPDYWRMYFCCTHNRPPGVAMHLPTNSPFYLYRFGGQCQKVRGMSVTEEFIDIDTEDTDNGDLLGGPFHPDMSYNRSVGRFRFELCYYH